MRNAGGYAFIVNPDAPSKANFDKLRVEEIPSGVTEFDTFSCCHCNRVIHIKAGAPMDEFGSMCRSCMKMTCPACADGPCVPFMKKIEQMEQKEYIRRQYEL